MSLHSSQATALHGGAESMMWWWCCSAVGFLVVPPRLIRLEAPAIAGLSHPDRGCASEATFRAGRPALDGGERAHAQPLVVRLHVKVICLHVLHVNVVTYVFFLHIGEFTCKIIYM